MKDKFRSYKDQIKIYKKKKAKRLNKSTPTVSPYLWEHQFLIDKKNIRKGTGKNLDKLRKRIDQLKMLNLHIAQSQFKNKMISKSVFAAFAQEKDLDRAALGWHGVLNANGRNWYEVHEQLKLGYITKKHMKYYKDTMGGKFIGFYDFFDKVLMFERTLMFNRKKEESKRKMAKEDKERERKMGDIEDEISGLA